MAALITYNAWLGTRLNVYDTALALDHIVFQPARLKRQINDSLRMLILNLIRNSRSSVHNGNDVCCAHCIDNICAKLNDMWND